MKKETKKQRLIRINGDWLAMLNRKDSHMYNYLFNNPDKDEISITQVIESMDHKQLTLLMRSYALAYTAGCTETRKATKEAQEFKAELTKRNVVFNG